MKTYIFITLLFFMNMSVLAKKIQIGDTLKLNKNHSIVFIDVLQDFRCPPNAVCEDFGRKMSAKVLIHLISHKGIDTILIDVLEYGWETNDSCLSKNIKNIKLYPLSNHELENNTGSEYSLVIKSHIFRRKNWCCSLTN